MAKSRQEIEQRIEELSGKEQLTDADQQELRSLKRELEGVDEEITVRVGPEVPKDLYDRLEKAAKREHMSVPKYMLRAAEAYLINGEQAGRASENSDLRDLCDLSRLHAEAQHLQIKGEIARRVKRQYGVDLNANGDNGTNDAQLRERYARYVKAAKDRAKFKTFEEFKNVSESERLAEEKKVKPKSFFSDYVA